MKKPAAKGWPTIDGLKKAVTTGSSEEKARAAGLLPSNRLPTDPAQRKEAPVFSGVLAYFPDALAEIARLSKAGNDQHNPGEPMHWAREKSGDHADCVARHLLEHGTKDVDGISHTTKMAWRALALLQLEIEAEGGLPPSRGSK